MPIFNTLSPISHPFFSLNQVHEIYVCMAALNPLPSFSFVVIFKPRVASFHAWGVMSSSPSLDVHTHWRYPLHLATLWWSFQRLRERYGSVALFVAGVMVSTDNAILMNLNSLMEWPSWFVMLKFERMAETHMLKETGHGSRNPQTKHGIDGVHVFYFAPINTH